MKRLLFLLTVAVTVGVMAGIVNAQEMSQDFGVANFAADTDFASQGVITHTGTGSTDLGFEASGRTTTNQPPGAFGVFGNQFEIKHFSSTFTGVQTEAADPIWGVDFGNVRTGFIRFDSVDLRRGSSLSMSIGEFAGGTNTGDDDVVIRVYLNGDAGLGTDIFDTRAGANGTLDSSDAVGGATYTGTTLSYNFADTDTSAILYVAILTDDAGEDGYYIDDVVIGNPYAAQLVAPIDFALIDLPLLEWSRPEPLVAGDTLLVDVLFGTEPNLIVGVNGTILAEQNYDGDSTGNFGRPLTLDTDYYWRVDVIDPNGGFGGADIIKGTVWRFITTVPAEVSVTESDGSTEVSEEGATSDTYNISLSKLPAQPVTVTVGTAMVSPLDISVSGGNDDSEEHTDAGENGRIESITSTDLELGREDAYPDQQLVGMRFNNINIPNGATITSAYLEFTVDEADSGQMSLTILGELSPDVPSPFTTAAYNLSSRPRTSAEVYWIDIPDWVTAGNKYQTPDITSIVSEITGQDGWIAGNSLVLLVEAYDGSTGCRTADSYEGGAANAPLLHIEWTVGTGQLPVSWSPPEVVLNGTNWETGVDVTVTAIDDTLLETDPHMFTLPNTVSSADAEWDALTANDVVVSILENECGAWGFAPVDLNDDCVVDLADLAEFASQFGLCTDPHFPAICDDIR